MGVASVRVQATKNAAAPLCVEEWACPLMMSGVVNLLRSHLENVAGTLRSRVAWPVHRIRGLANRKASGTSCLPHNVEQGTEILPPYWLSSHSTSPQSLMTDQNFVLLSNFLTIIDKGPNITQFYIQLLDSG